MPRKLIQVWTLEMFFCCKLTTTGLVLVVYAHKDTWNCDDFYSNFSRAHRILNPADEKTERIWLKMFDDLLCFPNIFYDQNEHQSLPSIQSVIISKCFIKKKNIISKNDVIENVSVWKNLAILWSFSYHSWI
jgi:hypothetical protein